MEQLGELLVLKAGHGDPPVVPKGVPVRPQQKEDSFISTWIVFLINTMT